MVIKIIQIVAVSFSLGTFLGAASAQNSEPSAVIGNYPRASTEISVQTANARLAVAQRTAARAEHSFAEISHGDYSKVVIVSEGEETKCGQIGNFANCHPLTDSDKKQALTDAAASVKDSRKAVVTAEARLAVSKARVP